MPVNRIVRQNTGQFAEQQLWTKSWASSSGRSKITKCFCGPLATGESSRRPGIISDFQT